MCFRRLFNFGLVAMAALSVFSADESEQHYKNGEWRMLFKRMEKPDYPFAARQMFITGAGLFRMYVDRHGTVIRVAILKSTQDRKLDEAAVKGLMLWRAKPGQRMEVDMPVTFTYAGVRPEPASREIMVRTFDERQLPHVR